MFIATLFIIDTNWKQFQCAADKWNPNLSYPCSGTLPSKLKEQVIDTCNHMNEAQK